MNCALLLGAAVCDYGTPAGMRRDDHGKLSTCPSAWYLFFNLETEVRQRIADSSRNYRFPHCGPRLRPCFRRSSLMKLRPTKAAYCISTYTPYYILGVCISNGGF